MVEPAPGATAPPQELRARYRDAFRAWLANRDERELGAAYALGREAVTAQLSVFELAHRGYREVQEVARLEHEHVEQLRALADASVKINATLTTEETLQLTVEAAQRVLGARRATITGTSGDTFARR